MSNSSDTWRKRTMDVDTFDYVKTPLIGTSLYHCAEFGLLEPMFCKLTGVGREEGTGFISVQCLHDRPDDFV